MLEEKKVVYVEMTREAAIDLGLNPKDLVRHRFDRTMTVMPIETDDDEIIDIINRDQNRLIKEKDRESRCMVSNGNGKLIRCEGKCSECSMTRKPVFSLEASLEQGADFADDEDETDKFEKKELVRALITIVRQNDSLAADICELYLKYGDKKSVENELGITRSVLDKKLKKIARENAQFNIF